MPNAIAPISRPMTVTLNATRRLLGELLDVARGEAGEGGGERDQRPHEPERGTGAHEDARALEPPQRDEVVLDESLGHHALGVRLAPVVDEPRQRPAHGGAPRDARDLAARTLGAAALDERPARALGDAPEPPDVAPPPARQLHEEAAELHEDDRQREHGEDQHRHPERLRDLEDHIVLDVARTEPRSA